MNQSQFHEDSYTYTNWLSTNFHVEVNNNPFKPEYEDDMDIVHEYDPYDYLNPNEFEESYPPEYYENGMFDEPPNIASFSDDEDEESYDTYEYM